MTEVFDVIVIGGGHNGLTCATYLAKAGRSVVLLEANDFLGGAASTREFADGFSSSTAHLVYQFDDTVIADLDLSAHGFTHAAERIPTIALAQDGKHLTIDGDRIEGCLNDDDPRTFVEFRQRMASFAAILAETFRRRPPRLGVSDRADQWTLAKTALKLRTMGRAEMRDFLRIVAINVHDVLDEYFASDLLKGAISFDAVLGTHLGPRSPNSVMTYLHRLSGAGAGTLSMSKNGMGTLTAALASAATAAGVEIRRNAPVQRIRVENGCATGVELADGEMLRGKAIASSADPKRTLLTLLGARHLETGLARRIHNIRMNGNVAKLDLALSNVPEFPGVDASQIGSRLLISPDTGYVERAFNHAKYGEVSAQPAFEILVPTIHDASLAPDGSHVLSVLVQYAPYKLKGGWTEAAKSAFESACLDELASFSPGLRESIVASRLLTPVDIEHEYGMTGGHWHHGELALDQMFMMRPAPGTAQYATPVPGLYLCGAGCHPGGGLSGLPGRNAAMELLARNTR